MNDLDGILNNKYTVISVMGPHAGESVDEIFRRKIEDINKKELGKTFWLNKSHKAKPSMVQRLCKQAETEHADTFCIFVEASTLKGAQATKTASSAKSYSKDRIVWHDLPRELSPVTGKIDEGTHALVFDRLELVDHIVHIDLWSYADFFNQELPLEILQGGSTLCAIKKDMRSYSGKIKSHYRKTVAVGRLCDPFCVYLR